MIKYFLNVIDMRREGRWDNKGACVLYLEFVVDVFKLVVYLAFFGIILTYYGIPLHIIRQLYYTFASFRRRVIEVRKYRLATSNMNAR
jgi:E3 ubiquitin-protein ligase synoviolin